MNETAAAAAIFEVKRGNGEEKKQRGGNKNPCLWTGPTQFC